MASSSGGVIADNFQKELNSLLVNAVPVSKEKINQIVQIAINEIRNYKHVVYYTETFIKNCSAEYKIPGLYVIDAIIRNCRSQVMVAKQQKEVYTTRFSKNICKTFSHLYSKSSESDREKISRVLSLWQKYSIFDAELIDRLNRISSAASIDSAINGSGGSQVAAAEKTKNKETINVRKFKRLQYLQTKLEKQGGAGDATKSEKITQEMERLRSELLAFSCPNPNQKSSVVVNDVNASPTGTKREISKLLNFDDDDSYSDSELIVPEHKQTKFSKKLKEDTNNSSLNLTSSERMETSFTNCKTWLQKEEGLSEVIENKKKQMNLPDLSQPPPPLPNYPQRHNEVSSTSDTVKTEQSKTLPNVRDNHISICSKTLWLGHLAKCTTEDYVIDELTELLSPSSNVDPLATRRNRSAANRLDKNGKQVIVDCQIIPPRGCAYIEFIDRKTASKCLERMKDGYRLEGNAIKVAWATNKGINKDRVLKQYWNVEVGCAYVPWSELKASVDFVKWAEGGLVDEESLPMEYRAMHKQQMSRLSNTTNDSSQTQISVEMDLDTECVEPVAALPPPPSQALTDLQKQLLANHLRGNQVNLLQQQHNNTPPPLPPPPQQQQQHQQPQLHNTFQHPQLIQQQQQQSPYTVMHMPPQHYQLLQQRPPMLDHQMPNLIHQQFQNNQQNQQLVNLQALQQQQQQQQQQHQIHQNMLPIHNNPALIQYLQQQQQIQQQIQQQQQQSQYVQLQQSSFNPNDVPVHFQQSESPPVTSTTTTLEQEQAIKLPVSTEQQAAQHKPLSLMDMSITPPPTLNNNLVEGQKRETKDCDERHIRNTDTSSRYEYDRRDERRDERRDDRSYQSRSYDRNRDRSRDRDRNRSRDREQDRRRDSDREYRNERYPRSTQPPAQRTCPENLEEKVVVVNDGEVKVVAGSCDDLVLVDTEVKTEMVEANNPVATLVASLVSITESDLNTN